MGSNKYKEAEIDEATKDIIVRLKNLPFAETEFCCSGHPDVPEKAHYLPYIVIAYDPAMIEDALKFHNIIINRVPFLSVRSYIPHKIEEYRKTLPPDQQKAFSVPDELGISKFGLILEPGSKVSYDYNGWITKRRIDKFWNAWRDAITEYERTTKGEELSTTSRIKSFFKRL